MIYFACTISGQSLHFDLRMDCIRQGFVESIGIVVPWTRLDPRLAVRC